MTVADLAKFGLSDMVRVGSDARRLAADKGTVESTAKRLVEYFYSELRNAETGERNCVLVRFYLTQPVCDLPEELQQFATTASLEVVRPQTKCLTLLATRGDVAEWNSRHNSANHKAIPLHSLEAITQLPMIYRLVQQIGIEVSTLIEPRPDVFIDLGQKNFNVFHVADALGSEFIPAQDNFVIPHNVKSVLGFGGLLPNAELCAIILFSRHSIPRESAEMFKTIALNVRTAIVNPALAGTIFKSERVGSSLA